MAQDLCQYHLQGVQADSNDKELFRFDGVQLFNNSHTTQGWEGTCPCSALPTSYKSQICP